MMNRSVKQLLAACAALVALAGSPPLLAQATFPTGPNPAAVSTYHSIGVYWFAPPGAGGGATVRYKEAGTPNWKDGLELWYDSRNTEYRGSLVELNPGTSYDIELTLAGSSTTLQSTTWSEKYPIGTTIIVPPGTTALDITTANSGSATGYTLVTAPPGANTIVGGSANWCIRVRHNVHHVIIRGLVLQDCPRWGVFLEVGTAAPGGSDIVIEDNEIKNWGALNATTGRPENDGAVHCNTSSSNPPNRITIQRNDIHDPRHGSNAWGPDPGVHPAGAQGVMFGSCGQNHVIRYNEIYSTNGNHWNDGMGGCCNFSAKGFPFADSDIYGNRVSHAYDDAIEAEGANRNVRIWANYIDRSFVAIANAATHTGPLYVWRNVSNDMALMKDPAAPNEGVASRGPFVKAGSNNASFNGGRAYYFHNTLLQPPGAGTYPRGAGNGLSDSGGSQPFYNFVSLNNIWHIHRVPEVAGEVDYVSITANCNVQGPCVADYDLFNGRVLNGSNPAAPEVHGTGNPGSGDESKVPTYATSGGNYPAASAIPSAANGWSGSFALAPTSQGYQAGLYLPNFSYVANPDPGAHQSGTPPMSFGRKACLPYSSSCKAR